MLGWLDLTLFSTCAVVVLDGLGPSAAVGPPAIAWYPIALVLLFIPYGLIIAELGSTFPSQGGLYEWIRLAFGGRWAARCTWYYWANVALGMPSVYVLFSSVAAQLFFPQASRGWILAVSLAMTWLTVLAATLFLGTAKWVPNLGAAVKLGVILVLGVGGMIYASQHGVANDLSIRSILPSWNSGVAFLPVIVFNFLGFEVMSGASQEMENPRRDVPIAILVSGCITAVLYLFATCGILLAIPAGKISLISSTVDTLKAILGESSSGAALALALGTGVLFTFFATMVTWTLGVNRVAARAAEAGRLPAVFSLHLPESDAPLGANLITGLLASLALVVYWLCAGSSEQLFWTLFSFGSIIFLLPYVVLFPAFVKLRRFQPEVPRPYRLPGGMPAAVIAAASCLFLILQAIVLFIWVPSLPVRWESTGPLLAGVALTIAAGEILLRARPG